MYQIDFNKPIHVYFCGIGGISMSGLAEILLSRGFRISGSDMKRSEITDNLESSGMKVYIGQRGSNITDDIDLFIYTAAIHEDNPEWVAMKEKNIPSLSRAELLGEIMKNFPVPVAIAGTHGKTTTTSMISQVLLDSDADPTLSIGGILRSIGGNIRIGHSDLFVTEACEYTNSFLSFFPKVALILNIEEDHMDFFKDIDDIRSSFRRFAELLPKDGTLIINGEIDNVGEITSDLECKVITYGSDSSFDYYPSDITYDELGHPTYILHSPSGTAAVTLSVPGAHNVSNSLAAFACADVCGIDREKTSQGLKAFTGTDRRFEYKGKLHGVTILDDYAHHPTEIKATLSAARNLDYKRLVVIFQPHTYTRTRAFLNEFAEALSAADLVVLADIYAAREKNTIGISSDDLRKKIEELGTECEYFPTFDEIENFILENCSTGDLLITMGAGDVVNIGESLLGI
ncbi:MAG: UDP-N-acetylmuramate--L-alanine ligase [Lachnospiraceae bacterium]|nr:UDP-N-acetylmuramate--L-alanine ligase [Lachnospiraceae bacterium]